MNMYTINLRPLSDEQFNVFKSVASKYLYISPNGNNHRVLANTCIDLDKNIKEISDEVARLRN